MSVTMTEPRVPAPGGEPVDEVLVDLTDAVGVQEMLAEGLTYRMLDHWTVRGYLRPLDAQPGSGKRRAWTAEERAIARAMLRLISYGFTVEAAARMAREHATSEQTTVVLGPNALLCLLPSLWASDEDRGAGYPAGLRLVEE